MSPGSAKRTQPSKQPGCPEKRLRPSADQPRCSRGLAQTPIRLISADTTQRIEPSLHRTSKRVGRASASGARGPPKRCTCQRPSGESGKSAVTSGRSGLMDGAEGDPVSAGLTWISGRLLLPAPLSSSRRGRVPKRHVVQSHPAAGPQQQREDRAPPAPHAQRPTRGSQACAGAPGLVAVRVGSSGAGVGRGGMTVGRGSGPGRIDQPPAGRCSSSRPPLRAAM